MKHFLNFRPTIIYRKGSSFLLKTSLLILYLIPAILLLFVGMKYFDAKNCADMNEIAKKRLAEKSKEFHKNLSLIEVDLKALKSQEETLLAYNKISRAYSMSWSSLLADLEKVTPKSVKFDRVRISPSKIVKVMIGGKAKSVSDMTDFLRALFASKSFVNPYLKHQMLNSVGKSDEVIFNLEVGYLPEGGALL